MADKPREPSEPTKPEPKPKTFDEVLKSSKPYEPASTQRPDVQLVGRVRKSEEVGKLILLIPTGQPNVDHAVEINRSDVTGHEPVFEDESGESTHTVNLSPDAQVKLLLPA